jgi:hypothetical protein
LCVQRAGRVLPTPSGPDPLLLGQLLSGGRWQSSESLPLCTVQLWTASRGLLWHSRKSQTSISLESTYSLKNVGPASQFWPSSDFSINMHSIPVLVQPSVLLHMHLSHLTTTRFLLCPFALSVATKDHVCTEVLSQVTSKLRCLAIWERPE